MTTTPVRASRARRWRLRARTRLMLWYSLLLAGTLAILGVSALVAVRHVLYASLDDALLVRALAFDRAVGHELDEGERGSLREAAAQAAGLDLLRFWTGRGQFLLGIQEGARLGPADAAFPGAPGGDVFGTERLASGTVVRTITHPLQAGGRTIAVVQLGRSTVEVEGVLTTLRLLGLAGLAVALALAWLGGTFLAHRALAPIDRIRRSAEQIGAEDLSRRLDLDLPDDEIGRLARAFDGMIARLDAAFARQRQFTADASHELRTPLGIMRSEIDVALAQPRAPEEYTSVLASLRLEIDRLSRLTEQLLTLARADRREAVTFVPVDLQDLVAETGASVSTRARSLGVHLAVELDDVPDVLGDPPWLTQVLLNLLDNALRHTPPGGRVTVRLAAAPLDGAPGASIRVEDTGPGIAPEHLPRLFERFYRVDAGRGRLDGGTGLGLAICDWVARLHRGQLSAESTLGVGTAFTLWLPAAPARTGSETAAMSVEERLPAAR